MAQLGSALILTVVGMGVVFGSLALLMVAIAVLKTLFPGVESRSPSVVDTGADQAVIAAVAASALSAYLGRKARIAQIEPSRRHR